VHDPVTLFKILIVVLVVVYQGVQALSLVQGDDSLLTTASAAEAASKIQDSLSTLDTGLASVGAGTEALAAASSMLGVQTQSLVRAVGGIQDADVAAEVVNLTKFQILGAAGTTALARSNDAARQILSLLQ